MASQRATNTAVSTEGDLGHKETSFDPMVLTKTLKEVIKSITDVVTKKSQSEVIKSTVNRDMDKIDNVISAIEKWYHSGGLNSTQSRVATRLFQPTNMDSEVTRLTLKNTELSAKLKLANTQLSEEQVKSSSKNAEIETLKEQVKDLQRKVDGQQSNIRSEISGHLDEQNTPVHLENILTNIRQENEQIRQQIAKLTASINGTITSEGRNEVSSQHQGQSNRVIDRPRRTSVGTRNINHTSQIYTRRNNNNRDDERYNVVDIDFQQQRFNNNQRNKINGRRDYVTEGIHLNTSRPHEPPTRRPSRERYPASGYNDNHDAHPHGQDTVPTGTSRTYAGVLQNNIRRMNTGAIRPVQSTTFESTTFENRNRRNQKQQKPLAEGALRGKPLPTDGTCLLVSHVDPEKTSEEVVETFKANVIPSIVKIQISAILRLSAARIAIIAPSKESIDKLKSYIDENLKSTFNHRNIEKKRPLICFTNLPKEFTSKRLLEEIKVQNEILQNINEDDLVEAIIKKAGENIDIVMRCEPQIYTKLMEKGFVYSQYQKIRVRNFSRFHQCYQCQEFGHTSKTCKQGQPTCGVCAGTHRSRECTLNENPICSNCKKYNQHTRNPRLKIDPNHFAYSRLCPIARRMREITNQHTDYGL